jgi:hypothetical protein
MPPLSAALEQDQFEPRRPEHSLCVKRSIGPHATIGEVAPKLPQPNTSFDSLARALAEQ